MIKIPVMKDNEVKIFNIFEFFSPEYFKVVNSLLLKSFIKNLSCNQKMNGNISKSLQVNLTMLRKL